MSGRRILARLLRRKKLIPETIVECGAGPFLMSRPLLPDVKKLILIDPYLPFLDYHKEHVSKNFPKVLLETHNVAIHNSLRKVNMRRHKNITIPKNTDEPIRGGGGSMFCEEAPIAPVELRVNKNARKSWHRFSVKAKSFSDIDTEGVNLLILDMEGAEWLALQDVVSLPKVILIELHKRHADRGKISIWMSNNGYVGSKFRGMNHLFIKQD